MRSDARAGGGGDVPARRVVVPRPGGPGVLEVRPFDPGPPGPGEVAIEVRAIGVNYADVFCRLGLYAAAPPFPMTPGFEVAGTVAAAGRGVTRVRPGDRVMAVTRFGGYATRVVVAERWVEPLPDGWSFVDGAAFPVAYLTAWHGLVHVGRLAAGETVVVQSAAGGVGMAACAIARALGARVIGTVGSPEKEAAARRAGAEEVVVTPRYDAWPRIRELAGGGGVDLVLDAVGGPRLRDAFEALRPVGRLVCYGFSSMTPRGGRRNWPRLAWQFLRTPRFHPFDLVGRNRTVAGFNLVHLWDRAELFRGAMDRMLALAREGRLRPFPGPTFPFEEAGRAQEALAGRRTTGRVVLVVG